MTESIELTSWQRLRTRLHLYVAGVTRRLTVGVRAVLLDGGKVLLVRHTYVPGWQFPGGGVEPNETAEHSASREVVEETGYATVGRPQLHGIFLNRVAGGGRDHVAVYVWHEMKLERAFKPNFEIAECRWFGVDALPPDIEPGTARRLREIAGRLPPPTEW